MKHWLFLGIAIVAEVTATSALKASEGFSRLWPSAVVVLVALLSWWLFGQKLDLAALLGMGLIVAGVLVMNLFSSSTRVH